jgi:hypothetical protein
MLASTASILQVCKRLRQQNMLDEPFAYLHVLRAKIVDIVNESDGMNSEECFTALHGCDIA